MFHSEMLARVIHADRVRDLERAGEARRLLAAAEIANETVLQATARPASNPAPAPVSLPASPSVAAAASCRPATRDGAAGVAA